RIANDLHEDINQQLAGLSIALSNFKRRLHNGANTTLEDELTRLQQCTIDLADVIRNLSYELHPSVLQHVGLAAVLTGHCSEFSRERGLKVTTAGFETINGVSQDIALCLYRVAEEALRNIAAHAGASEVKVSFNSSTEWLELTITDDGQGFDLAE